MDKKSRLLGFAFLFQAITSMTAAAMNSGLDASGGIGGIMAYAANHAAIMNTGILLQMATAAGIIFLGAVLFVTLRKQHEKWALAAFGLYILEAAILVFTQMSAFTLLHISQESVAAGQQAYLQAMASAAHASISYGGVLAMLPFCLGALPFYYFLYRARVVPRILSLWGLLAVFPCLVGTLSAIFGYQMPFAIYYPYVPFEPVIGIWIIIKGIRNNSEPDPSILAAPSLRA